MSTWRRKALEFLPQFRIEIEGADTVGYLWVEISSSFYHAVESGEQNFIDGTLKYLIWSLSDNSGEEAKQAVSCGFLEDITSNRKHWQYFSSWFTKAQFEQYKGSFMYALSDKELKELTDVFYAR
ncbi:hypothetical protein [Thalassotalea atypica]|uniref:hypothetical protein n=1 Tax=Thalassotalea atypica TaxID=2054316 RepID=UPI0025746FC3|nr:hypothetical protein [Thalassotalea atypica]